LCQEAAAHFHGLSIPLILILGLTPQDLCPRLLRRLFLQLIKLKCRPNLLNVLSVTSAAYC
jgi:hypothetical protein